MVANLYSLSRLTSVIAEHIQAADQSYGRYGCGLGFPYSRPHSLKGLKLESSFPDFLSVFWSVQGWSSQTPILGSDFQIQTHPASKRTR